MSRQRASENHYINYRWTYTCWFPFGFLFVPEEDLWGNGYRLDVLPVTQPNTEGNLQHWPQPGQIIHWPCPFLIHRQTLEEGVLLPLHSLSTLTTWTMALKPVHKCIRCTQQHSHSNIRIKIHDFSGPDTQHQNQHLFFVPFRASTYEFDSKTRHCLTKNAMPMQYFFVHSTNYYNSPIEHQWWQTRM